MIHRVEISRFAEKQLRKIPQHIRKKLQIWVQSVEDLGLEAVRKSPGYHDEPLHGRLVGKRSIRLNDAYRAIYVIKKNGSVEFVNIEEVNKHEYKK